jgi:ABC-2 type transport system permease protein
MPSAKRIFSDLSLTRRESFRDRTGLFFSFFFPIILIVVFGLIFSGSNSGPISVYVQNQDESSQPSLAFVNALNSTGVVSVVSVDPSVNLPQFLLSHSYSQGIVIPKGFGQDILSGERVNVTVYDNPADSSSAVVIGEVNGIINAFNLERAGTTPVIGLSTQPINFKSPKYIDFLVPGLVGLTILTGPMFSMVNISAENKKEKLFKQLSLTPLTKVEWLISKIIWYTILALISFALMVGIGVLWFNATVVLSLWVLPFLILGPLFFVSLGMLVGSVTKTLESAGVVGNVITFPMMFLSGTFFPVALFPTYLQSVARVLPLYYVISGLNAVMIYSNYSGALIDMGVVAILSAIIFSLAVKLFKWRED